MTTLSACLVVHNEEKVIERCLKSIASLAHEIIIVHDGLCTDKTIDIARKFTDKIFIREYRGIMEAHLVFAYEQVSSDWILRIDADEYLSSDDFPIIKSTLEESEVDALILKWELWNERFPIFFRGLQKMCFFRKKNFHYCGIPHETGWVDRKTKKLDLFLRHRPVYNNISWETAIRKRKKWVPIHAQYFFPEKTYIECFNTTTDNWKKKVLYVRAHPLRHVLVEPLKMLVGQLKNGLIFSRWGWQVVLQQYVYYLALYCEVWKIKRKLKLH